MPEAPNCQSDYDEQARVELYFVFKLPHVPVYFWKDVAMASRGQMPETVAEKTATVTSKPATTPHLDETTI